MKENECKVEIKMQFLVIYDIELLKNNLLNY